MWIEENPDAKVAIDTAAELGPAGAGVVLDVIHEYHTDMPDGYVYPPSAGLPPAQQPEPTVGPDRSQTTGHLSYPPSIGASTLGFRQSADFSALRRSRPKRAFGLRS